MTERPRRFARDEESSVALDGDRLEAELLQRLEDQAAALAEATSRLAVVESALEAERALRKQQADELHASRLNAQQESKRAERFRAGADRVPALEEELRRERANSEGVAAQLADAWAQIQSLKDSLHRSPGLFRRRPDPPL